MSAEPKADPSWWAFRYIAGELDPEVESAFEHRLEWDQAAREAVAEAVELAEAVALLGQAAPTRAPRGRPAIPRTLGWLAVGAAACLALVIGLRGAGPDAPERHAPPRADAGTTGTVALTWSGLRHDGDRAWQTDLLRWLDDATAPAETDPPASDETETGLPSWLLEVASLQHGPTPAEGETKEN